jgi:hypothetical protein
MADWEAMVSAAKLDPAEFGVTTSRDEKFSGIFVLACGTFPSATAQATRAWSYVTDRGAFVGYAVGAYDPQPGSAVIDQARAALSACTDWTTTDQLKMTVLGEFPVDRPTGTDGALAFCYALTYLSGPLAGGSLVTCQGMVSRGPLVAMIGTYDKTRAPALARLDALVPLAATGLRQAMA